MQGDTLCIPSLCRDYLWENEASLHSYNITIIICSKPIYLYLSYQLYIPCSQTRLMTNKVFALEKISFLKYVPWAYNGYLELPLKIWAAKKFVSLYKSSDAKCILHADQHTCAKIWRARENDFINRRRWHIHISDITLALHGISNTIVISLMLKCVIFKYKLCADKYVYMFEKSNKMRP